MDNQTFKHYIQELIDSSQKEDVVKLRVQLDYFDELNLSQQLEAALVAKQNMAPSLVLKLYEDVLNGSNEFLRKNSIVRKTLQDVFISNKKILKQALTIIDPADERSVKFIDECILNTKDEELQNEFNALKRGEQSNSREDRMATILTLGKSGNPEDIDKLLNMVGIEIGFDIIIVNQLMNIGSEYSYTAAIKLLDSPITRLRSFVETKFEEVIQKASPILIRELPGILRNESYDQAISLVRLIGASNEKSNAGPLRKILLRLDDHTNLKIAIYEALVRLDPETSMALLIEQLCEPNDDISFTAVTFLNDNVSTEIIDGIERIVDGGHIELERLAELLLFGSADKLIVHVRKRKNIEEVLRKVCSLPGMEQYGRKYGLVESENETKNRGLKIWAVDDSRIILRMYEHFAVETSNWLVPFESCKTLLERLAEERPDMFFIDLNMPETNGVELAMEINKKGFSHIPKILVTTQSNFEEDREVQENLFNAVVSKPFTTETLSEAIKTLTIKDIPNGK